MPVVNPGIRRFLGSAIQRLFNGASFSAPLTHSAIPTRAASGTTATFTRATTKTWSNNDGYLVTGVAGEIGFVGARRVFNLWTTSSVLLANGANKSLTLAAGVYQFSMGAGTGTATFSGTGGATGTLAASASGRVFVSKTISAGTLVVTASVADLADLQVVSLTSETDQTTIREYVSVGVASSPYYHGSMVDGVKCFPTDISGNPIPLTTLLGYSAEGARTNHFLQSGTPATQTSGSLSTGTYTLWMDGTGSIAVAGATATITGAGTATSASAVTFTVTVAGTVTYTVTGSPTRAQSENGAFRSSYIPTTTIAVARNADVLTYSSSGNISGTAGAAYAEAKHTSGAVAGGDIAFLGSIPAGGIPMLLRSGTAALVGYDGAYRTPTGLTAPSAGVVNKMATTWGGTSFNSANNGVVGVAAGFDGDMNFPATLQIGCYDSVSHPYGTIRNVRIGQRQLSSSELQAVTA